LLAAVGSPLLATGLAGLYVLLAQQPEKPRLIKGPAITGLVLAGFATWLPLIIMLQLSTAGQILVPLQPFFRRFTCRLELWSLPLATFPVSPRYARESWGTGSQGL
jgi:hypothetical protein